MAEDDESYSLGSAALPSFRVQAGAEASCPRRPLGTEVVAQRGGLSRVRQGTVEPVFGQIKSNRGAERFQRRGRSAVRSEWRLLTATHNLLKLHRHQLATA